MSDIGQIMAECDCQHSACWDRKYCMAAKVDSLTAKLAKVLQAAKPLAAMAERYDPEDDDGDLECWSGLAVPKIKHIRALRTAIADIKIECQE